MTPIPIDTHCQNLHLHLQFAKTLQFNNKVSRDATKAYNNVDWLLNTYEATTTILY